MGWSVDSWALIKTVLSISSLLIKKAAPPSSCQAPKSGRCLLCLFFSSALHLYSLHGPCFTDFFLYQGLYLISADTLNAIAVGWNLRYHLNVRKEVCVWPDNQTELCSPSTQSSLQAFHLLIKVNKQWKHHFLMKLRKPDARLWAGVAYTARLQSFNPLTWEFTEK